MNAITIELTPAEFGKVEYASLAAGIIIREWSHTMLDLATCDPPGVITLAEITDAWGTSDAVNRFTVYGDPVNFQWWRTAALGTRFPPCVRSLSRRIGKGEKYLLECWAKVTLKRAAKLAIPNR